MFQENVFENIITFNVPKEVSTNWYGYNFLAYLAGRSIIYIDKSIRIDFEKCTFFEGSLCSVLGNILQSLLERNNQLSFINLTGSVRGAISRNGFLHMFLEQKRVPDLKHKTSIPFNRFSISDEAKALSFFTSELFEKENMPQMSDLARKEIIRNIFEVCLNAVTHGGCEFVYCCGQVYPRRGTPKAILTLTDLGRTIKANVNEHLGKSHTGSEAIEWALKEGNTTKTSSIPGGLGLKLLQNLIKVNNGKLQFVSADGFVEIVQGKLFENRLDIDFPGTIVTIELLLKDPNFYILKSEEDDWNNFF